MFVDSFVHICPRFCIIEIHRRGTFTNLTAVTNDLCNETPFRGQKWREGGRLTWLRGLRTSKSDQRTFFIWKVERHLLITLLNISGALYEQNQNIKGHLTATDSIKGPKLSLMIVFFWHRIEIGYKKFPTHGGVALWWQKSFNGAANQ